MSGSTIVSPSTADTTLLQDGQATGAITPSRVRQTFDSGVGLFVSTVAATSYTFLAADYGQMKESTSGSPTTFIVPPNSTTAFQINTVIAFRQYGTGPLTIQAGAGVTLRTATSLAVRVQYGAGTIHKRATDEWVVAGDMT